MIFSEKDASWSKFSNQINVGDIFQARVGSVEDYGAFVHLRFPDGRDLTCQLGCVLSLTIPVLMSIFVSTRSNSYLPCDAGSYHLTGLVHVSEVSWDLVHDVRDILTEGDDVRVKIINIDRYFLMIMLT